MTGDVSMEVPPSFAVLFCPLPECGRETPFYDPMRLIEHLCSGHGVQIKEPKTVLPFLAAYLAETRPSGPCILGDDGQIRQRLQREKLEEMLRIQETERQNLYPLPRVCLWCEQERENLPSLFRHMYEEHGFNCGLLDNLVMVGEYLAVLETLLSQSICIYCEREYQNRTNLRRHLKAKGHVKINPRNHTYDRYYLSNYIINAANGEELVDGEDGDEDDEEWNDLRVPVEEQIMCLFCEQVCPDAEEMAGHFHHAHHAFELPTDDYERIKAINYLRCCQRDCVCPVCQEELADAAAFSAHLTASGHSQLPADPRLWQQAQYLFPTYDDDPLLTSTWGSEQLEEEEAIA